MTTPARAYPDDGLSPAPPTAALVAVPDHYDATDGVPPRPAIARSAAIGAVLGFVVVASVITALVTRRGYPVTAAFGLGAFVGAFGGGGFGCMMGAVLALARSPR
jgi:hypothetical protein